MSSQQFVIPEYDGKRPETQLMIASGLLKEGKRDLAIAHITLSYFLGNSAENLYDYINKSLDRLQNDPHFLRSLEESYIKNYPKSLLQKLRIL